MQISGDFFLITDSIELLKVYDKPGSKSSLPSFNMSARIYNDFRVRK